MTGESITFPPSEEPTKRRDPQNSHAELVRQRTELVKAVRAAAEDPNRKFARDDEIGPAQAVDRLIADAKAQKIKQNGVLEALCKKGFPAPKFDRLRANHRVPPSQAKRQKGAEQLIRKVQPYVRVLEALAELLTLAGVPGRTPDDVLYDAFRNTEFWQSAMVSVDDLAPDLTWLLHEMARFVIRSEHLADYFLLASTIPSEYHPDRGASFYCRFFGPASPEEPFYYERVDLPPRFAPRFPGVPLLRIHGATFSSSLRVERIPLVPPDCTAAQAGEAVFKARASETLPACALTDTLNCMMSFFMDVRLVIAPQRWIGSARFRDDDLVPMFQIESYGELNPGSQHRTIAGPLELSWGCGFCHVLFDRKSPVAVRFDDGWRRVTGAQLEKCAETETSELPWDLIGSDQSDQEAIHFARLDAATVRLLMNWLSEWHSQQGVLDRSRWLCPLIGPHAKPSEFRYEAERCREFETALYTGAIEAALVENCRDLRTRLEKRIAERKATLDSQDEAMLTRWRKTDSDRNSEAE